MSVNVGDYSSFNLLAALGGLHLLPPNIQQLPDLKAAACIVASDEPHKGKAATPSVLERLLSSKAVRMPVPYQCPNPLTTALTYVNGCHVALAGWEEDSDWIARRVLEAVELSGENEFRDAARQMAAAALSLGAETCARAGLQRNLDGQVRPMRPASVPGYGRVKALAAAVTFSAEQLNELCGDDWEAALAALTADLPLKVEDRDGEPVYLSSALAWRPLVRKGDNGLILALPGDLLLALSHAVVRLASEYGSSAALEEAFNALIATRSLKALAGLGFLIAQPAPNLRSHFAHSSSILQMDTDKVLHLVVVEDDLDSYEPDHPFAESPSLPSGETLDDHLAEVEQALVGADDPPNEVLHLIVCQTISRPFSLTVNPRRETPLHSGRLIFSCAELEVIASSEKPDLLLLWEFARSIDALRGQVALTPISQLDEFYAWREGDFSFDQLQIRVEGAVDPVTLLPGVGGEMRKELAELSDVHGVTGPHGDYVEVERFLEDPAVDLYVYQGRIVPPDIFVVGYGEGIWVTAAEPAADPRQWEDERKWTELVAFWLWRLRDHVPGLTEAVRQRSEPTVIAMTLHEGESTDAFMVDVDDQQKTVRVAIGLEAAATLFGTSDNTPERDLIAEVLFSLATVCKYEGFDRAGTAALTREWMPTDVRKLLFMTHADPAVRPIAAPKRHPSGAEIATLMSEVGLEVAEPFALAPGVVPAEHTHDLINTAVASLLRRLEAEVATLKSERLLEWLISANEALVHDGVVRAHDLQGDVACYGRESNVIARRMKQSLELASASVPNRFLIEYVAAQPPHGLRPVSYSAYDRLLAIASQIVSLGTMSDLLHYELGAVELLLLPTGRLMASANEHGAMQRIFAGQVASGDIKRSAARVESMLKEVDIDEKAEIDSAQKHNLDQAFENEFGFSFGEAMNGLNSLCRYGVKSEVAVTVSRSDAEREILKELDCDGPRAARIIDAFALGARQTYMKAPAGHSKEELYPWRFNRRLSYVRRPLVLRKDQVVFGPAGVFRSMEFLSDLLPTGRLRAQTHELRAVISQIQQQHGREFNDRVAELFEKRVGCQVRRRVEQAGGNRIQRNSAEPLGDIDVLVFVPGLRLMIAIETKALAVALTPHQLSNEIEETFGEAADSSMNIHTERCAWLLEHRPEALRDAGLEPGDAEIWQVQPLIAVDEEVLSPLIGRVGTPVRSWQELVRAHEAGELL